MNFKALYFNFICFHMAITINGYGSNNEWKTQELSTYKGDLYYQTTNAMSIDERIEKGIKSQWTTSYKPEGGPALERAPRRLELKPHGNPAEDSDEKDLRLLRHRREKVKSPHTKWPYQCIGHLIIYFSSGRTYDGTGFLVGPCHVLTAAHNLFDHEYNLGWASSIIFHPGVEDGMPQLGEAEASTLLVPPQWLNEAFTPEERRPYDMGMIILHKNGERWLGDRVGWLGIIEAPDSVLQNKKITIAGYPSDKPAPDDIEKGFPQLWEMTDYVLKFHPEWLRYWIDTATGNSGSPLWSIPYDDMKDAFVSGIHVYGRIERKLSGYEEKPFDERPISPDIEKTFNQATRISSKKFDLILKWINYYWPVRNELSHFIDQLKNNACTYLKVPLQFDETGANNFFDTLRINTSLECLDLSYSTFNFYKHFSVLATLPSLTALTIMNFSKSSLDNGNIGALAGILMTSKTPLILLNLANNTKVTEGNALISLAQNMKSLLSIDLQGTGIKDEDKTSINNQLRQKLNFLLKQKLSTSIKNTGIQTLLKSFSTSFVNNAIDEEKGLSFLVNLLDTLPISLKFTGSHIGDEGADLISLLLKANINIQKLYLDDTAITDKGIGFIAEALKINSNLTNLNLQSNLITNVGIDNLIRSLSSNKALKILTFEGPNFEHTITDKFIEWLLKVSNSSRSAVKKQQERAEQTAVEERFRSYPYSELNSKAQVLLSQKNTNLEFHVNNINVNFILDALRLNLITNLSITGYGDSCEDINRLLSSYIFIKNSRLHSLKIENINLSFKKEALKALKNFLKGNTTLNSLGLIACKLADDDLKLFSNIKLSIKKLILYANPIGNRGMQILFHALNNNCSLLEAIDLHNNSVEFISDTDLIEFINSHLKLRKINFLPNTIDDKDEPLYNQVLEDYFQDISKKDLKSRKDTLSLIIKLIDKHKIPNYRLRTALILSIINIADSEAVKLGLGLMDDQILSTQMKYDIIRLISEYPIETRHESIKLINIHLNKTKKFRYEQALPILLRNTQYKSLDDIKDIFKYTNNILNYTKLVCNRSLQANEMAIIFQGISELSQQSRPLVVEIATKFISREDDGLKIKQLIDIIYDNFDRLSLNNLSDTIEAFFKKLNFQLTSAHKAELIKAMFKGNNNIKETLDSVMNIIENSYKKSKITVDIIATLLSAYSSCNFKQIDTLNHLLKKSDFNPKLMYQVKSMYQGHIRMGWK